MSKSAPVTCVTYLPVDAQRFPGVSEYLGGLSKTSNTQNLAGIGNKRRDIYLKAADDHRAAKALKY